MCSAGETRHVFRSSCAQHGASGFLGGVAGAISLMRSHQPIIGRGVRRLALWSLAGTLSLFWMIVVLIVGIAL